MMLTPESKLFLENLKALNLPPVDQVPIEILRSQFETGAVLYGGVPDQSIPFHDDEVLLENLNKTIKLRTFEIPFSKMITLYAHGGGWIRGNINTHHVMCQNLAKATQSTVISIEYSLSPEHPYPTALNEVEAVYQWAIRTQSLPISLCGDSAGGNLMAGLIVRLNQHNQPLPQECIFIYPALDLTQSLESSKEFAEGYSLTRYSIRHYISAYLGNNTDLTTSPEVSPLWALENIDFPPTLIIAAGADPLRDESRMAKDILAKKGSLKGYLEVPGVLHGFSQLPVFFPEAAQAFNWLHQFYKA